MPVIGNIVRIYSNFVVIGDIAIGDNVNIGNGSIVLKVVSSDCTVVGEFVYIVK